jgi:protein involved in polysaccharide export with SLBB domain
MNKLLFLCFVCLGLASVPAAENAASNPKTLPANPTAGADGAQSSTSGVSADYVLAPSDLIEVQVYGEPDLLRDVRISRDDTIVLPLIGEIDLTAKTLRQAEDVIRTKYGNDYLVNPQVNLMVKEYSKRTVSVLGEVAHPGPVSFPLEQGLSLVDAISAAGGMTELAKLTDVLITRTRPDGTTYNFTVDLKAIIDSNNNDKGEKKQDIQLMVNDVIFVHQIFMFKS